MTNFRCMLFVVFGLSIFSSGCGTGTSDKWEKQRPETFPVSGRVTWKGEPLSGATVTFRRVEGDKAAVGMTDEDGKFKLMTFEEGDGAISGDYQITVVKYGPETPPPADYNPDLHPPLPPPELLVPARYADFEKSGFTATVKAQKENVIHLELKE